MEPCFECELGYYQEHAMKTVCQQCVDGGNGGFGGKKGATSQSECPSKFHFLFDIVSFCLRNLSFVWDLFQKGYITIDIRPDLVILWYDIFGHSLLKVIRDVYLFY